ncbi:methyltransferase [Nitratireductor aquimarinus]|uniref:class I SAM-dependent methyltransferase n=1 Tax=Nitratireductor TaxID=245876 RepID=UPI0019D3B624|nr:MULTISPECIES: methyltransferase [Nitratireductor]MBN7777928.1 methyltransferase [Nitratireductor pacificus]MBN7782250.1 methyltransferase [Nitratireductor pacificus]MBN7791057.1 methyltransferase [Nitratireductor aquimarinus]MBY6100138.1 methyltransferase [Nitratireductor aquimarinus]MCA1262921.1 methyltransferase [Nitratireductor aquimarinus]
MRRITADNAAAFIRANTALTRPPHVPEIALHLADEAHDLWQRTEEELAEIGLPPPFWAFAWAGGQGLARYVLDHPETVRDRTVLDFATGSGLVAIAAAMAGAKRVMAADIDPFSAPACALNMAENHVQFETTQDDLVGVAGGWDVVLAGDVFYDRAMTETLTPWFERLSRAGSTVIVGDPGRSYLPRERLSELAVYTVPVTRALEDAEVKRTTVWQFT